MTSLNLVSGCPDQATDVIFFVKAPYHATPEQWATTKHLISKVAHSVQLGRGPQDSRVGVALYDNTNEVRYVVHLDMFGRASDLSTAVAQMNHLPCGSWCDSADYKSDAQQLEAFLPKLRATPSGKAIKIYILGLDPLDENQLQPVRAANPDIVIQQLLLPQSNVIAYNAPYHDYYQSYYDTYRRYAERMQQVYPNVEVPVPADTYPYQAFVQNQYYSQSADPYSGTFPMDPAGSSCYQLTGCSRCYENFEVPASPAIPSIDEKPITLPSKSAINDDSANAVTTPKALVTKTEEYEYEITADPPGIQINKTPLHDNKSSKEEERTGNESFDITDEY
ncbi:unnamed protein product [Caenorhabditis auriculariae]|uniref:VWFA domain-containing protein n=1 Tax=Caenorhabditis auriculariae TaxID=2777116 RepID=A0A8S1GYV4_9PELO|nr:unnamed protein product [Caenorhabditis auriculariae]